MSPKQRKLVALVACIGVIALISVTVGYLALIHLSMNAVSEGRRSLELFGVELEYAIITRIIEQYSTNPERPWPALVESTIYSKAVLAIVFASLVATVIVLWQQAKTILRDYFTATTHPVNLAVFRIVLFGFAAFMFSHEYLMLFASLPTQFLVPPVGTEWLLELFPVDGATATWSHWIFFVASLAAAAGLTTRISTVVALLAGVYVLGIPNFYGKVDHYHHIVWFMAILAVSPCGDTLSIDALVRAWRRGHATEPLEAGIRYALPLRFVWLLIGVCYFFPGLWKLIQGGFAWPLGDTFRTILYRRWEMLPGFVPPVPLDQYPLLYRSAASAAVLFELSFLFLILFPGLRRLAVALGLAFHNVTGLMMRIWFIPMQVSYVSFIDWHRVFRAVGLRLFPSEARLEFDPSDVLANRIVAMTRHVDLLQRVTYDTYVARQELAPGGSMRLSSGDRVHARWRAYLALIPRVPGALFLLPILLAARAREQSRPPSAAHELTGRSEPVAPARRPKRPPYAVMAMGTAVLLSSIAFGMLDIHAGWPFAVYPTFARGNDGMLERLQVTKLDSLGNATVVDVNGVAREYGYNKFRMLVTFAARTEDEEARQEKLTVLHRLLDDRLDELAPSDHVRFHVVTEFTDPQEDEKNPISKVVLAEFGAP